MNTSFKGEVTTISNQKLSSDQSKVTESQSQPPPHWPCTAQTGGLSVPLSMVPAHRDC